MVLISFAVLGAKIFEGQVYQAREFRARCTLLNKWAKIEPKAIRFLITLEKHQVILGLRDYPV